MPRKVKLAKRPEYVALEILEVGKAVTPSDIDKHVGTGKYSSKYMSFLKRDGYSIQVNKDGRAVVSYTLLSKPAVEPKAAAGHVKSEPKPQKAAMVKAKKEKKPVEKKAAKETPVKEKKVAAKKAKKAPAGFVLPEKKKSKKVVEEEAPISNGEMTSYSVDPEFDSATDFDPRDLA